MKNALSALTFLFLICGSYVFSFGQTPTQAPLSSRGYALEVTYFKGRPFAYQGLGQWTVYGAWAQMPGFKLKAGELPIDGIRVVPRDESGILKIKVTVLRGEHWEAEDFVGDYRIGDDTLIFGELANFGVVPFEVKLVRAPPTVADLPSIINNTKSLVLGVEPVTANLPSFRVSFLNSSDKPVSGFAHKMTANGTTRRSGMPKDRQGGTLIAPGETYSLTMTNPTNLTAESTGEIPSASAGLQFHILAVMFADGSYEGDAVEAARFKGYKVGEKIQLGRILEVLRSPSAGSAATLEPRIEELSFKIDKSDVVSLLTEFPGLPAGEIENVRAAAGASAADIQKGIKATFGKGSSIDPKLFDAAVNGAIAKCEKWLNSIP